MILLFDYCIVHVYDMLYTEADPGFGIRGGGVNRRGAWVKVPQRVQDRALVGGPGGETPPH